MVIYNDKEFGINLRNARKKAGLSQENLAYALNVTTATISRFEKGVTIPTMKQVWIMCNEIGINVSELLDNSSNIINKENSKNPFKTKILYLYYKGIYPTTKKMCRLKFKLEITEHLENVTVNLLDYKTNKIYMTGYLLADNHTAIMVFENYKPNSSKLEVGKIVINISSNLDRLMMGALSVTNNDNVPNERKCILSKKDLEFTDDLLESLKITEAEFESMKKLDAWYMNINNKEDYEE